MACLVIGVLLAWLVTRTRLPGRRVWAVVAALPLAVPTYVAAFAWVSFFPRFGGYSGSLLVLTVCCYPYVYLPVVAVLERIDPAQEEVARSLGLGPVRVFLSVTLRQVRPAAAAGGLLVALYVLSDFGSVAILRYDVFTRVIFNSYQSGFDPTPAAILGIVLVAITVDHRVGREPRPRPGHLRPARRRCRPVAPAGPARLGDRARAGVLRRGRRARPRRARRGPVVLVGEGQLRRHRRPRADLRRAAHALALGDGRRPHGRAGAAGRGDRGALPGPARRAPSSR